MKDVFAVVAVNQFEMIALRVTGMKPDQIDTKVRFVSGRDYRYEVCTETADEAIDAARGDNFGYASVA